MLFFLVAFGLLLHVLFWGAGLAWLIMPGRWRRFWPVLAAPVGFALQSLVVWAGAYAGRHGTDEYAWWSEALPLGLLAVAWWRFGGRKLGADWRRLAGLWVVMSACLVMLTVPLSRGSKGLTTVSLGSCDAADYAAGARVLMEFSRGERGGFMGLTEVVRVASVDNFFEIWLRLNHFTPAALVALNGTIFDCAPRELVSLMTVVLLAGSLPVVFWGARAVMGLRGGAALWIALLYGLSPLTWYAVFHVAMGQLLAAQAIALLTWAGIALGRGSMSGRAAWAMSGVLAVGYILVLGSYNFILIVCLVPALAYAGGMALWKGEWLRFGRWLGLMLVPLVGAGLVMAERVAGLVERFRLFQSYDFGWRIPGLTPEGWLGMVSGPGLTGFSGGLRVALAAAAVAMLGAAMVAGAKRRRREVFVVVCLAGPALIGYGYLNLRGVRLGTNASYDAYKILSVFYPGMLAALCWWVVPGASRHPVGAMLRWAFALAVTGFTLNAAYRFADRMENPPLVVDRDLQQLKKVEAMDDVASVNMMIPDMWSRLWANALLLRMPQYFLTHTYEGRLNTSLRGEWDLNGGLIEVRLPDGGSRRINATYSLTDTRNRYFVRVRTGEGWHDLERLSRSSTRWRWTKGDATLSLENPHARPVRIVCRFNARSEVERDLQIWLNGKRLRTVRIGTKQSVVRVPEIAIPAGTSMLELRSSVPPTPAGPGDKRELGFIAYGIEIEVRAEQEPIED